jgi:hypothetical protein
LIAILSLFFGAIKPVMDQAAADADQAAADTARAEAQAEADAVRDEAQAAAERALENPSVDDTVYFGDIYWRVLDVRDGRALLISKYILEERIFNSSYIDVTWETCSLRTYLNNEFLSMHFSEEDQSRIVLSMMANDSGLEYEVPEENAIQDRVFLLSIDEANHYFSSDSDRVVMYRGRDAGWWLRSTGKGLNNVAFVTDGGSINSQGPAEGHRGVRPALWLNLST